MDNTQMEWQDQLPGTGMLAAMLGQSPSLAHLDVSINGIGSKGAHAHTQFCFVAGFC